MKYQMMLCRPSTLHGLRVARIGIWSLVGVLTLTWSLFAIRGVSADKENRLKAKSIAAQIKDAEQAIRLAKSAPAASIPVGLETISSFQEATARIAAQWDCKVSEFQASPQLSPYLCRFTKDTKTNDWVQIDVTATFRGAAPNLVEMLKALAACGVPFEFNSIDLRRSASAAKGGTTVTCVAVLRLLTRAPGGKA